MLSRIFAKIVLCGTLMFSAFSAPAAVAEEVGTSAFVLRASTLLDGPGTNYSATNISVTEGQSIGLSRCTRRWCKITNADAWLSIDDLSFGQSAKGPYDGPKFATQHGGDGLVCLYDGANYSGASICLPAGATARDLALWGWDDKISSVSVGSGVSVNLCRDRFFTSYCSLIIKDTPNLERFLANSVSSYRVW